MAAEDPFREIPSSALCEPAIEKRNNLSGWSRSQGEKQNREQAKGLSRFFIGVVRALLRNRKFLRLHQ
jgi:hypothetical protein